MIAVMNTNLIPMDDETDAIASKVMLKGTGEEIARDYVALTLKLNTQYPEVMEIATSYLENIVGMED